MKRDTRIRKLARKNLIEGIRNDKTQAEILKLLMKGKMTYDECVKNLGKMVAEAIMLMEREEISGPDYHPTCPPVYKWASQKGSIYIGGSKVPIDRPRLRDTEAEKEIPLNSYRHMKDPDKFSESLLTKLLAGISENKYHETVTQAASHFGISPTSVSRKIVLATAEKLKELKNSLAEARGFFYSKE